MITIEEVIIRAIEIRGNQILCHKNAFCALLEDLAPELTVQRVFLESIYTDELGDYLLKADRAEYLRKDEYLRQASRYLLENRGFTDLYRDQFEQIFRYVLIGHTFEVRKYKDYLPVLRALKKSYGGIPDYDVIRYFVEYNRLFLRFSLTVDDVMNDLKKI